MRAAVLGGLVGLLLPATTQAAAATDSADQAGRTAFQQGRYLDAARHFRDALDNHPAADEEALRLLYNLGRSHQELAKGGDTRHDCEAAKWFEQQIRLAERLGLETGRRVEKARTALVGSRSRCRARRSLAPEPVDEDGQVQGALLISVSEGALLLDSGAARTAVMAEVAVRFGNDSLQGVLGAAMAVERPNAGVIRAGLVGLLDPAFLGISVPVLLRPVKTVGVRAELGLRLPLADSLDLELGVGGTMWPLADDVRSVDGRAGVAAAF